MNKKSTRRHVPFRPLTWHDRKFHHDATRWNRPIGSAETTKKGTTDEE